MPIAPLLRAQRRLFAALRARPVPAAGPTAPTAPLDPAGPRLTAETMPVADPAPPGATELTTILRKRFGHPGFRGGQDAICAHVAAGGDALVVMPTGAGKSICYQLPAVARGGTTLVVSPLLALMKDQVDALNEKGIRATAINSSVTTEERKRRMSGLRAGEFELVYVAPERFTPTFLRQLEGVDLRLLAIDEAHCLSQWGHDFRPDYLRLGAVRKALGGICTVALTATATPQVQEDIARTLGIEHARRFVQGFDRENLRMEVIAAATDKDKLARIPEIASVGPTLVYCATRKNVEKVSAWLRENGVQCGMYHGGMDHAERVRAQDEFMGGGCDLVVATNAFGMGVDKDNVRAIVHYDLPGTVEAYYQEIGRAGRDGKTSRVVLLFRESDRRTQEFLIKMSHPPASQVRAVYEQLEAAPTNPVWTTMEKLADAASARSREEINDRNAGSCVAVLRREGWVRRIHHGQREGMVVLRRDRPAARPDGLRGKLWQWVWAEMESEAETTLQLRPDWLAQHLDMSRDQLMASLRGLEDRRYLEWIPPEKGGGIELLRSGEPLDIDEQQLMERRQLEYVKLDKMVGYAHAGCRRRYLLEYFGQKPPWERCGNCDACREGRGLAAGPQPLTVDEELVVRKLLATVARMKKPFSASMIAKVASGSRDAGVLAFGFERLSTWGILRTWTVKEIEDVLAALVAGGALEAKYETREIDGSERTYKVLELSPLGWTVMKQEDGAAPFEMRFPKSSKSAPPPRPTGGSAPVNTALLEELRALRTRLARAEDVPAYVIAPNRTLEELAAARPVAALALKNVHGMGPERCRKYGGAFLDVIRAWTAAK